MAVIYGLIGFGLGFCFCAVAYASHAKKGNVFYQLDEQRSGWAKRSDLEGAAWTFPSKQPKNT